jgi:hypothetical protein
MSETGAAAEAAGVGVGVVEGVIDASVGTTGAG